MEETIENLIKLNIEQVEKTTYLLESISSKNDTKLSAAIIDELKAIVRIHDSIIQEIKVNPEIIDLDKNIHYLKTSLSILTEIFSFSQAQ